MINTQLPEIIFVSMLKIMKDTLDLGEFAFEDKKFRYFKREIMNICYKQLENLFLELKDQGVVEVCECGANLRQGWSACELCHGCGYKSVTKERDP
jgi:hypothetical protein